MSLSSNDQDLLFEEQDTEMNEISTIKIGPEVDLNWPNPVSCEMRSQEWEVLMKEIGLNEEIDRILTSFREGFHLGIPPHRIKNLRCYTPKNRKSAEEGREKIDKNLQTEREAGRMCGPYSCKEV